MSIICLAIAIWVTGMKLKAGTPENRYVVRAFLPDTKISDVNVKLENNKTLQVSVNNQQNQTTEKKNIILNLKWLEFPPQIFWQAALAVSMISLTLASIL